MNTTIGWALAVLAVAVGYAQWGWPGVVLAVTVVVFWLLLQFSRALRIMRQAGGAPVGAVDSAVMLHAKLRRGMRLLEIIPLTRSLGAKVDDPGASGRTDGEARSRSGPVIECFRWADSSGASVTLELVDGRLQRWSLARHDETPA